jgi:hypothetical protein
MSKGHDQRMKALALRPDTRTYEVGYGKPPASSYFKLGQSGNPRGRPRGSKNRTPAPALNEERLKSIVVQEAYRKVCINDANGSQVSIPMAQAVVRSLAVHAAKGNQRAQRLFTELLASVERDNKRLHDEWLSTAIEYKVEWGRELERRKSLGIEAAAPIPHPDDITIDMRTGSVRLKGPMTKEDKVVWDQLRERKQECDRAIGEMTESLGRELEASSRQVMLDDIEHEKKLRGMISSVIPD